MVCFFCFVLLCDWFWFAGVELDKFLLLSLLLCDWFWFKGSSNVCGTTFLLILLRWNGQVSLSSLYLCDCDLDKFLYLLCYSVIDFDWVPGLAQMCVKQHVSSCFWSELDLFHFFLCNLLCDWFRFKGSLNVCETTIWFPLLRWTGLVSFIFFVTMWLISIFWGELDYFFIFFL